MQIKHVEELVGITRKNIRFYEEQGLLKPHRADNGYREYHEEEINMRIWRSWNVRKKVWNRCRK